MKFATRRGSENSISSTASQATCGDNPASSFVSVAGRKFYKELKKSKRDVVGMRGWNRWGGRKASGLRTGMNPASRQVDEEGEDSMRRFIFTLLAFVLGVSATGASLAQDEEDEMESGERDMDAMHCIRIQGIDEIDIVDSDTMVFRMRGGEVYQNELPRECPGLRQDDTLMYRSSVGQLCSVDIVTVLEDWGFGFSPGASCGLGMFHPITEQIADELVQGNR